MISYGTYDKNLKKITIKEGMDEETIKSVVFHEMSHAIMNKGVFIGFGKEYVAEDIGQFKITTAVGLTEGFTQYITNLRNESYYNGENKNIAVATEIDFNSGDGLAINAKVSSEFNIANQNTGNSNKTKC